MAVINSEADYVHKTAGDSSVGQLGSEAIKHSLDLDTLVLEKSSDCQQRRFFNVEIFSLSLQYLNKDNPVNSENYFYKISFVPVHKCLSSSYFFCADIEPCVRHFRDFY